MTDLRHDVCGGGPVLLVVPGGALTRSERCVNRSVRGGTWGAPVPVGTPQGLAGGGTTSGAHRTRA
ncbi:hypothetical protein [Streptomyces sp. NPDC003480]